MSMDRHPGGADQVLITQGEYAVGSKPAMVISTILGSCVAVCLWDARLRAGGMNHILLPDDSESRLASVSFGASDMERLMNALLKRGAARETMQAKVFGGAKIVANLSDIGARNVAFVRRFLRDEAIQCLSESVGGVRPRQVRFWPESGRVQQRFVGLRDVSEPLPARPPAASDVELF